MSEELMQCTPPELSEIADAARVDLLPQKSREKYDAAYAAFIDFQKAHKTTATSQNVLCAYFKELSKTSAPSTLWNRYFMLKASIKVKNNIDISSFENLVGFIRQKSVGYQPKQSEVLTKDQVRNFLENAPDDQFLAMKVAFIMGLMGTCRCQELRNIKVTDIEDRDTLLVVSIPVTKTNTPRKFVIVAGFILNIVKKFRDLRPQYILDPSFFVRYRSGKCTNQVMGKHLLAAIPKEIAKYLRLSNHNAYTGHCLRRTAATIFSNEGGDFVCLKELGGWKSDAVTQRYIKQSINQKTKISNFLTDAISLHGTNLSCTARQTTSTTVEEIDPSKNRNNFVIQSSTVHIHNYAE